VLKRVKWENNSKGKAAVKTIKNGGYNMEPRLIKRKLPADRAAEILNKGEYGVLSTCGGDGQPYGVPLNYACEGGKIYFHCAKEGRKLDNIAANVRVCFTVTGSARREPEALTTKYESVVALGRANKASGREKRRALELIVEKYAPGYMDKGMSCIESKADNTEVVVIEIDDLCGKSNL
jgi:nitroimidazol reductase NimA-like FMN-containing flavoprotein (pyridoxamine 5'-phosphate oxidase superfamily)